MGVTGWQLFWAVLLFGHLLYSFFFSPHIYFSDHDVLFQWMTKSLVEHGSFFVKNGHHDIASVLFTPMTYYAPHLSGEAFTPLPPLYPLLGIPFFLLYGVGGLFNLSALTFAVCVWMTFLIARLLFSDRQVAHVSALVFAIGTFAWPFSQTALPHLSALALALIGAYIMLQVYASPAMGRKQWIRHSLVGGIFLALAIAARLDSMLFLPLAIIPFLFAEKIRWKPVVLFIGVTLLGLLPLAFWNWIRHLVFFPISYGQWEWQPIYQITTYLPMLSVAFGAVVLAFYWRRAPEKHRNLLGGPLTALSLFGLGVLGGAFVSSEEINSAIRELWSASQLQDKHGVPQLLQKSFLQAVPVASCLPMLLWLAWQRTGQRLPLLIVFGMASFVIMMSGLPGFLNNVHFYPRLLLPALPFVAIGVAVLLVRLSGSVREKAWGALAAVAITAACLIATVLTGDLGSYSDLQLVAPQLLCLILIALQLAIFLGDSIQARWLVGALRVFGIVTAMTVGYTAVMIAADHRAVRALAPLFQPMEAVVPSVDADSLVLTAPEQLPYMAPLLQVSGVRVAMRPVWGQRNFILELRPLLSHFSQNGMPIYTLLPEGDPWLVALQNNGFQPTPVETAPSTLTLTYWEKASPH